jgi:hypothetical protein
MRGLVNAGMGGCLLGKLQITKYKLQTKFLVGICKFGGMPISGIDCGHFFREMPILTTYCKVFHLSILAWHVNF